MKKIKLIILMWAPDLCYLKCRPIFEMHKAHMWWIVLWWNSAIPAMSTTADCCPSTITTTRILHFHNIVKFYPMDFFFIFLFSLFNKLCFIAKKKKWQIFANERLVIVFCAENRRTDLRCIFEFLNMNQRKQKRNRSNQNIQKKDQEILIETISRMSPID